MVGALSAGGGSKSNMADVTQGLSQQLPTLKGLVKLFYKIFKLYFFILDKLKLKKFYNKKYFN
jgi:hypothetical protein